MTKKPATKKPKTTTLKDLATQLKANQRRMDEMGQQITALYGRAAGLNDWTDVMSRDVGTLTKRANAVDHVLTANAATHRNEVDRISKAVVSLQTGQLAHAHMISALEKAATDAQQPAEPAKLSANSPGDLLDKIYSDRAHGIIDTMIQDLKRLKECLS